MRAALEKYRPLALYCALESWSAQGNEQQVEILLAAGAPTNLPRRPGGEFTHDTPLHQAAYLCHPGVIRRLLEAGAWVADERYNGFTPLHCWVEGIGRQDPGDGFFFATEDQIVESGALLLAFGANPDFVSASTPAVSVNDLLRQHDRSVWIAQAHALASAWAMEKETGSARGERLPSRL